MNEEHSNPVNQITASISSVSKDPSINNSLQVNIYFVCKAGAPEGNLLQQLQ